VAGVPATHLNRDSEIYGKNRTIFEFNQAIEKNASHGDCTTREVGVIVHSFTDFNTCWRVDVSSQKRKDVILALLSDSNLFCNVLHLLRRHDEL